MDGGDVAIKSAIVAGAWNDVADKYALVDVGVLSSYMDQREGAMSGAELRALAARVLREREAKQ